MWDGSPSRYKLHVQRPNQRQLLKFVEVTSVRHRYLDLGDSPRLIEKERKYAVKKNRPVCD